MSILNPTEIQLAVSLGPVTHLCIFIHGELDSYATYIASSFIFTCLSTALFCYLRSASLLASLAKASILFSSYLLALGGSILVYRIFFHRLRRFPGDRIDALTNWGAVAKAQRDGQYFLVLEALHKKYGDFVRPNSLSTTLQLFNYYIRLRPCVPREHGMIWEVRTLISIEQEIGNCMIANVSFGIEQLQELVCLPHICKISRNFSDSMQQALQNYMLKINSSITMLLSELDTSQPIDISTFFENSAFELMASLVFSENFHTHSRSEISSVLKTLHTNQQLLIGLGHVPWIWTFQAWFPFLVPSAVKFRAFAAETINRRRKTMPEVPDLFSYLSQAEDSGNPTFPVDWEARLAMVAGSINDCAILTAITFYLATNPNCLISLRAELAPYITAGKFDMRQTLPILDSVINEALRLQPSIPSGTERLTPPSGITLYTNDGSHVFIPGNTTVRIPNYTLLRDARYFVHPESFIPERWTTRKELVIDASGFIPFGVGPYSCAGKQLGMMKTRATIAGLVMKFHWRLDAATDPEEFERAGKDEFSIAMGQCWVRFKKI